MPSSRTLGQNISVEVTHISSNGVWILSGDRELFMPYDDFPWFKEAPVSKIINIAEPRPGHFYWPDLDVNLTIDIIEHPERYPLKASKP